MLVPKKKKTHYTAFCYRFHLPFR